MNASLNFCLGQHLCLSFIGFLFSLVAIYDEHGWGQGQGGGAEFQLQRQTLNFLTNFVRNRKEFLTNLRNHNLGSFSPDKWWHFLSLPEQSAILKKTISLIGNPQYGQLLIIRLHV